MLRLLTRRLCTSNPTHNPAHGVKVGVGLSGGGHIVNAAGPVTKTGESGGIILEASVRETTYRTMYRLLTEELWREERIQAPAPLKGCTIQHTPGDGYFFTTLEHPKAKIVSFMEIAWSEPTEYFRVHRYCNWWPMEVFLTRKNWTFHFTLSCAERTFHFRNLRVHRDLPEIAGNTELAKFLRSKKVYDGPYVRHIEHLMFGELHDVAYDYGINDDYVRHLASWGYYLEHKEYVRWITTLMEGVKGDEHIDISNVFTEAEKIEFQYPHDIQKTVMIE